MIHIVDNPIVAGVVQVVPVRMTFVMCLLGALVLPGSDSGDARVHQWVWGRPSHRCSHGFSMDFLWIFYGFSMGFLWVFYGFSMTFDDVCMFWLGCLGVSQCCADCQRSWIEFEFCVSSPLCSNFGPQQPALQSWPECCTHAARRMHEQFASFYLSWSYVMRNYMV